MALSYYPNQGEILLCDYDTGFIAPEMVKRRPVVVISPRLRHRSDLVGVVPLSTAEPVHLDTHHCRIQLERPLPAPFSSPIMWAKCDMMATVAKSRLDRFKVRRGAGRFFVTGQMDDDQMKEIRAAVLCGLGLSSLTVHL